jgi:hypothetical protein
MLHTPTAFSIRQELIMIAGSKLLYALTLLPFLCGCEHGLHSRIIVVNVVNGIASIHVQTVQDDYFFMLGGPASAGTSIESTYALQYRLKGTGDNAVLEAVHRIRDRDMPEPEYSGHPGPRGWTKYIRSDGGTDTTRPAGDALKRIQSAQLPPGFYPFATKEKSGVTFVLAAEDPNPEWHGEPPEDVGGIRWLMIDSSGRKVLMPDRTPLDISQWDLGNHRIIFAGQLGERPKWLKTPIRPASQDARPQASMNYTPFAILIWDYEANAINYFAVDLMGDIYRARAKK